MERTTKGPCGRPCWVENGTSTGPNAECIDQIDSAVASEMLPVTVSLFWADEILKDSPYDVRRHVAEVLLARIDHR